MMIMNYCIDLDLVHCNLVLISYELTIGVIKGM